jgi:hypothetical protein
VELKKTVRSSLVVIVSHENLLLSRMRRQTRLDDNDNDNNNNNNNIMNQSIILTNAYPKQPRSYYLIYIECCQDDCRSFDPRRKEHRGRNPSERSGRQPEIMDIETRNPSQHNDDTDTWNGSRKNLRRGCEQ